MTRASRLLALFLVFGVLAPTGCVLWFMNAAARSQGTAARNSVTEAYRGQLRLLRDRADSFWRDRAAALDAALDGAGAEPRAFQRIVTAGLADSVVLPHYPAWPVEDWSQPAEGGTEAKAAELEHTDGSLAEAAEAYGRIAQSSADAATAERAAQAQIRCLVRSGDREGAFRAVQRYFVTGRLRQVGGRGRRSIAADELLLGLRLLKPGDARLASTAARLADLLNDYGSEGMPSAQRVFLMDELRTAFPKTAAMPTVEAERLALRFVDAEPGKLAEHALERTGVPGIWKIGSGSGRAVALYRTATVQSAMQTLFQDRNAPQSATFSIVPPGTAGGPEAIAAGASLPGWQLSFALTDTRLMDDAARGRMATYLWIGYLAIAALAVTGALVGGWLQRESRLASLKTDLVAAVSHELRTPLASMRLLLETLLDEDRPEPSQVREYLGLIAGENMRLTRLVENFLAFSRIERNRQRFVFAPTAVSGVVEKALTAMGERLQPPCCELHLDVSAPVAPLWADEDAVVTVLVNLLDNACKYSTGERRIAVTARDVDGSVALAVSDHGIGIAPREQRRIFRRFYQVDQRLSRETGGCGLGLSIVEFVVKAHGGRVTVESSPGAGSTFTVTLPCAPVPEVREREAV